MAQKRLIERRKTIASLKPIVREAKAAEKAAEKALKAVEGSTGVKVRKTVKRGKTKTARAKIVKRKSKPSPVSKKIFALRINSVDKRLKEQNAKTLNREKKSTESLKKLKSEILKLSKVSTTLNKIETVQKKELKNVFDKVNSLQKGIENTSSQIAELKKEISIPKENVQSNIDEIKTLIRGKFVDFSSALELHGNKIGKIEERLEKIEQSRTTAIQTAPSIGTGTKTAAEEIEEEEDEEELDEIAGAKFSGLGKKMLDLEKRVLTTSDSQMEKAEILEKKMIEEMDLIKSQLTELAETKGAIKTIEAPAKSLDETAHDIVKIYFEEIARLGFKRSLDLEDTIRAYEFVRQKLSLHEKVTPEMIEAEITTNKFKKGR